MITYTQSRNIEDYSVLLDGLYPDFGNPFCHTILVWCDVMKTGKTPEEFWQVWLVKDEGRIIGICGLYSLDENIDTLWLGWFGIIPELRNKKLGCFVIDFLKETARSVGATKLMSYVGSEGKPLTFYNRNGFTTEGSVKDYRKLFIHRNIDFETEEDFIIECIL